MDFTVVEDGTTLHVTFSDAQVAVLAAAMASVGVAGSVRENASALLGWLHEQSADVTVVPVSTSTMCPGCGQNRQLNSDGSFVPHRVNHDGVTGPLCSGEHE